MGAWPRGIEGRLYYIREWAFDEGRCQMRCGAEIMATLRNLAVSPLCLAVWDNTAQSTATPHQIRQTHPGNVRNDLDGALGPGLTLQADPYYREPDAVEAGCLLDEKGRFSAAGRDLLS
jgi:hypothetical protein